MSVTTRENNSGRLELLVDPDDGRLVTFVPCGCSWPQMETQWIEARAKDLVDVRDYL